MHNLTFYTLENKVAKKSEVVESLLRFPGEALTRRFFKESYLNKQHGSVKNLLNI